MKLSFITVPGLELPVLSSASIAALYTAKVLFVDVRTAEEVAKGTIEGSMHVPLACLEDRFDDFSEFQKSPIVFYCKSGGRSDAASTFFRQAGFLHAFNGGGYGDILEAITKCDR